MINLDRFLKSLSARGALCADARSGLAGLDWRDRRVPAGSQILAGGNSPSLCYVVLTGLAADVLPGANGRRQITALRLPCDFGGYLAFAEARSDQAVEALSESSVAVVPAAAMRAAVAVNPGLGRCLYRLLALEGAKQRRLLLSIGQQDGLSRCAHLLCELHVRYKAVGLVHRDMFPFPANQRVLADLLGLSIVHINRVLGALRSRHLIRFDRQWMELCDPAALAALGDFDPAYLGYGPEADPAMSDVA